jgi:hypothetical protein
VNWVRFRYGYGNLLLNINRFRYGNWDWYLLFVDNMYGLRYNDWY